MAKAKKEVSKAMAKLTEALSAAVDDLYGACDSAANLPEQDDFQKKAIQPVRKALAKYDKVKEKIKAQVEKEKK